MPIDQTKTPPESPHGKATFGATSSNFVTFERTGLTLPKKDPENTKRRIERHIMTGKE